MEPCPKRVNLGSPRPDSDPPNMSEVKQIASDLKDNNAPSEDSITAEILKKCNPEMIKNIHALIEKTWKREENPKCFETCNNTSAS